MQRPKCECPFEHNRHRTFTASPISRKVCTEDKEKSCRHRKVIVHACADKTIGFNRGAAVVADGNLFHQNTAETVDLEILRANEKSQSRCSTQKQSRTRHIFIDALLVGHAIEGQGVAVVDARAGHNRTAFDLS